MIATALQCHSRYTVNETPDTSPIYRRDGRACLGAYGHDGPHRCLLGHIWTDEPTDEESA